jgi:hypothetical protein
MSELLESLAKSKILFYPGAGSDWGPLYHLADLCDTFIYCDWDVDGDSVRSTLSALEVPGCGEPEITSLSSEDLCPSGRASADMALLTSEEREAYFTWYNRLRPRGWGIMGNFTSLTNDRSLRLIYLGAEGVATYLQLFNGNGICPEVLVFMRTNGFSGNWTRFSSWTGPLARIARANCAGLPKYLVTTALGNPEEDYEWLMRVVDELAMKDSGEDAGTSSVRDARPPYGPAASATDSSGIEFPDEPLPDDDGFWVPGGRWPYYTVVRQIQDWNNAYVLER